MTTHPSGEQFEISAGGQHATIVEVGGGIRAYEVDGRPVLDPYPVEQMCDGAHGAPLIPWPNRLADGRYPFEGQEHQVALTEPEKHNAIHGFMRWRTWRAAEHGQSRIVMTSQLLPMQGYPYALDLRIAYELDSDGLRVTTSAQNIGTDACPYGHGQHPYLSSGHGQLIDDCELQFEAATRVTTDPERQLPTGTEPVQDTSFDFSDPRQLGELKIDDPFRELVRDADDRAWVRLWGPDGARAELWVDDSYPLIELYTGDTLAPERARRGLGVEPMSCPPNAFASGTDLVRLEPGAAKTTIWGARLSRS